MKTEPGSTEPLPLVPPEPEPATVGVREGDDGTFLFGIWAIAYELAVKGVTEAEAKVIADEIMESVAEAQRANRSFLSDPNPHSHRRYILAAVAKRSKNVWRDNQRHAKALIAHLDLIAANTIGQSTADSLDEDARLKDDKQSWLELYVRRAFDALPPICQEICHLRYIDEMKPRHIAPIYGIKPDSVNSHLKRGLARMREAARQCMIDHPWETE